MRGLQTHLSSKHSRAVEKGEEEEEGDERISWIVDYLTYTCEDDEHSIGQNSDIGVGRALSIPTPFPTIRLLDYILNFSPFIMSPYRSALHVHSALSSLHIHCNSDSLLLVSFKGRYLLVGI